MEQEQKVSYTSLTGAFTSIAFVNFRTGEAIDKMDNRPLHLVRDPASFGGWREVDIY